MIKLLLIVIGCYVVAGIVVHLYHLFSTMQTQASKHYVLIADYEQDQLEWYYRSLKKFSEWMGVHVYLTIVSSGVINLEHKYMVRRWQQFDDYVNIVEQYPSVQADTIVVHLNNENDLNKLPF